MRWLGGASAGVIVSLQSRLSKDLSPFSYGADDVTDTTSALETGNRHAVSNDVHFAKANFAGTRATRCCLCAACRRHSLESKKRVLAACAKLGASVADVAREFRLNDDPKPCGSIFPSPL